MTTATLSRLSVETLAEGTPAAVLEHLSVETLAEGSPSASVERLLVETLTDFHQNAVVKRLLVEILSSTDDSGRLFFTGGTPIISLMPAAGRLAYSGYLPLRYWIPTRGLYGFSGGTPTQRFTRRGTCFDASPRNTRVAARSLSVTLPPGDASPLTADLDATPATARWPGQLYPSDVLSECADATIETAPHLTHLLPE